MFFHTVPRVTLAHLPTPLYPIPRLLPGLFLRAAGLPRMFIKRDDLTRAALSGNKVRKLEFLLADALEQGASTILTCGGAQSNHCRATALSAARLHLASELYLRTDDPQRPLPAEGNILLDRLCGAGLRPISRAQYQDRAAVMEAGAQALRSAGRKPYVIPEGGSNAVGCLGYVACIAELLTQLPAGPLTLLHATGSGGTGAGLALGVALFGLPWRVVGVNVCDDRAYFISAMGQILEEVAARYGVAEAEQLSRGREGLELLDGFVGRGYALSSEPSWP